MRTYDETEATNLKAEQWQIDLIKMNPDYTCWGIHEDYMGDKTGGWNSPMSHESWGDFGPWGLDDLNECVNFHFEIHRANKECDCCGGNGYHPDAQEVVNGFYSHMNAKGESWSDKITDDEVQALLDAGRLMDWTRKGLTPTAAEVNAAQNKGIGHDAINRMILTRTRLTRLGLPQTCDKCEGNGYVYTAPESHVSLMLWMLHPRKGCSRGVEIEKIQQADLPAVFAWLNEAAKRNTNRFSKLPQP